MLIESSCKHKLLIDCGSDIRHSLFEQGIGHNEIDAVYISHLHADHVGGLEWFGFSKLFIDKVKPALYISSDQRDKLWNNVLSGGMSSLESEDATLATYFDVQPIHQQSFIWKKFLFQLIKVEHSMSNGVHIPAYGLLITGDSKKIFISTDSRFHPNVLNPIYKQADIIFHDCETSCIASGQHAQYSDLKTLDPVIKAKMWLYDYNDGLLPDAEKDGFKGFISQGQSFDF